VKHHPSCSPLIDLSVREVLIMKPCLQRLCCKRKNIQTYQTMKLNLHLQFTFFLNMMPCRLVISDFQKGLAAFLFRQFLDNPDDEGSSLLQNVSNKLSINMVWCQRWLCLAAMLWQFQITVCMSLVHTCFDFLVIECFTRLHEMIQCQVLSFQCSGFCQHYSDW
jgi:hypothetical protein